MDENLEMLLRRNRMSVDEMSLTERLMRQKNKILQRQLEVSLQILDKEGRTSQKQIDHLVKEYSEFLNDLPCRWVGLDTYTQPNTRALRKISLRDKRPSRVSTDGSISGKNRSPSRPSTSRSSATGLPTSPKSAVVPSKSPLLRPASAVVPKTSPRLNQTSAIPTSASPRSRPRSSPVRTRELPKFNTCIEVLDDIIQNHSLRNKPNRHRRIGLVVPPSAKSENVTEREVNYNGTVHVRPSSSHITSESTSRAPKEAHQKIRPHTAQPSRATGMSPHVTTPRAREDVRRPQSAVLKTKRPKSAPPKYELYGRSPAIPKRTVAGIMAEMHSRRAATRDMLGKSKQLQRYISGLAWVEA